MKFKKTILIDLDGVLNKYSGNYDKNYIPEPQEGAKNFLKKLNKDFKIIVFTTRNIEKTKQWINENSLNLYISEVTNTKKPCYLIIDDRAICHKGNFNETLLNIEKFEVYWKIK